MPPTTILRGSKTPPDTGELGAAMKMLGKDLAVWVQDLDGFPVRNAQVTWKIQDGGGDFGGKISMDTFTDALGIARAKPTLGKRTSVSPFYLLVKVIA